MSEQHGSALIVCVRVNLPPGLPPYPNTHYAQWSCPMCSEKMWVGPRSVQKHREEGVPIVCMVCAAEHGADLETARSLGGL